jgi:hypothetical protein
LTTPPAHERTAKKIRIEVRLTVRTVTLIKLSLVTFRGGCD